jgi:phosphoesterase RecJ-like protein
VNDLDQVAAALQGAPSVAVLAHVHPEADAIGATLGASLALREVGKVTGAYNADPLPPALACLPGAGDLQREISTGNRYACYLILDTSDLERTGGLLDGRPADAVLLNVDHHAGNTRFGDVNWVEPEASSAGEMVYRLLRRMSLPIGKAVATNLYAAILTDTGSFQHSNTTPEALRAAADLVACGAAVEELSAGMYGNHDPREWHLLAQALASLTLDAGGRLAWIEVTSAARERLGLGLEASEGFIDFVRAVGGVQIGVLFKEVSATEVRVSLRSRGSMNVAVLAQQFGGGGHRNAAGCTLHESLAQAKRHILTAARALVF